MSATVRRAETGEASSAGGWLSSTRHTWTDIQLRAEILSYSRTRGLFAGVTLRGSTIRADRDANERFYGQRLESREIVLEHKEAGEGHDAGVVERLRQALAWHVL